MNETTHAAGADVSTARAEPQQAPQRAPGGAKPAVVRGRTRSRAQVLRAGYSGADPLGGAEVDDSIATTIARRRGGGSKLPDDVASAMGQQFNHDFSSVRIHADSEADTLSRAVQARAFTLGSDIYFSSGAYAPGSSAGRHVLAHELTHVVQQSGSAAPAPVQRSALTVGRADDGAEVEAERVAAQVVRALQNPDAAAGPIEVEHLHGPGCGHEATVRRFFSLFGAAAVGEIREGGVDNLDQDDQGVPDEFLDLADAIQRTQGVKADPSVDYDDQDTFSSGTKATDAFGSIALIGAVKGTALGTKGLIENAKALHNAEDSFDSNIAAGGLAGGMIDTGGGVGSILEASSDLADNHGASEIPVIGEVMNFYNAAAKGKEMVENAVGAERLRKQKRSTKHLADQMMPDAVRLERFRDFYPSVRNYIAGKTDERNAELSLAGAQSKPEKAAAKEALKAARKKIDAAKSSTKSDDVKRFIEATRNQLDLTDASADADILAFLSTQEKEFGKGTSYRKKFEASRKEGIEDDPSKALPEHENYVDARSLGKVASFGHRRKAETAAVTGVEAAGHGLDGIGTFTAGADMGATKIAGKSLKGGAAAYRGVKGLVKRARRVHKLRKAKNALGYGDKTDRGMWWGAKQFFGGNVQGSMDKAKQSMDGDESGGAKKSARADQLTPKERAKLLRMLTLQAQRRVDDLIRCLGSDNDRIYHKAAEILHILAESSISGALAKIDDGDILAFRDKVKVLRQERERLREAVEEHERLLARPGLKSRKSKKGKAQVEQARAVRQQEVDEAQMEIDRCTDKVKALDAQVSKIGDKISTIVSEQVKGIGG